MRSAMSDSCPLKSNGCCIFCKQKKEGGEERKLSWKKKKTLNFLHSFLAVTVKVLCRWGPVLQVDQDACNYLHIKKVVAWPSLAESDERRGRQRGSFNTCSWSTKHSIMKCAAGGRKKRKSFCCWFIPSLCHGHRVAPWLLPVKIPPRAGATGR